MKLLRPKINNKIIHEALYGLYTSPQGTQFFKEFCLLHIFPKPLKEMIMLSIVLGGPQSSIANENSLHQSSMVFNAIPTLDPIHYECMYSI